MKKITCQKPCTFGGQRFFIGDEVPCELVSAQREEALVKYGYISVEEAPDAPATAEPTDNTGDAAQGVKQPAEDVKHTEMPDGATNKSKGKKVKE